ncbi:YraN family protein [Roseivirga sp. BDSF3-8]|uniref:YraN family protein n=1 Tax=Roseivirga sp. BDSF3-8 TaxID=3241598 RepID=UPI003531C236
MQRKKAGTLDIGADGEHLAESFLKKKGYRVLDRNFRYKRGEIDLIVQKDNLIAFVEVKTRKNKVFGNPEEFVSDVQAERIMEVAEYFIHKHAWAHLIRFDIVAITQKPRLEIVHLEDAIA